MAKKKKYLNNEDFRQQLINLNETGVFSNELHQMFFLLCKRIGQHRRFRNYTYNEDMVMSAYSRCVEVAEKFDTTRLNPFSYFTTVCYHEFFKTINDEHNQQDIRWKMLKDEYEHCILEGIPLKLNSDIKQKLEQHYEKTVSE